MIFDLSHHKRNTHTHTIPCRGGLIFSQLIFDPISWTYCVKRSLKDRKSPSTDLRKSTESRQHKAEPLTSAQTHTKYECMRTKCKQHQPLRTFLVSPSGMVESSWVKSSFIPTSVSCFATSLTAELVARSRAAMVRLGLR